MEEWSESLQSKDEEGSRTPLHLACFNFARNGNVSSTFAEGVIQYLVQSYPRAAKDVDSYGRIPIQLVFGGTRPNYLDRIRCLVEAYPESAKMIDDDGETLLHIACATKAPVEVVEYLLLLWPEAAEVANSKGEYPLHLACATGRAPFGTTAPPVKSFDRPAVAIQKVLNVYRDVCTMGTYDEEQLPLHLACEAGLPIEVVMMIALANRETAKMTNAKGELPLHIACEYAHGSIELARFLAVSNDAPEPFDADDAKQDPEQYLVHPGQPSTNRLRRTGSQVRVHNIKNFEVIKYLVELWPGAVSSQNGQGKTPAEISSVKAIANLQDIEINEEDYVTTAPVSTPTSTSTTSTNSYPTMAAATTPPTAFLPSVGIGLFGQHHSLDNLAQDHGNKDNSNNNFFR